MNRHIQDLVPAWLDGRLDAAARELVRAHCAQCAECRRALAESEAAWKLLGDVESPPPLRPVWPALAEARRPRRGPLWARLSFPAAAAAVLAAGILLGVQLSGVRSVTFESPSQELLAGTLLGGDAVGNLDGMLTAALTTTSEGEQR